MTSRSIAVIGGAGFVGSSLASYLSRSFDVTVLDIARPQGFSGKFIASDIRDGPSLIENLNGFSLVINAAIVQVPEINDRKRLGYEVNVLGIQNVCEAVESVESMRGLLHISSWHVFGEEGLRGTLNEESPFCPDKIDKRARLYALCKIAQEAVVRIVEDSSRKFYGLIRVGTILGEGMPKQTAANVFIEKALHDEPLTPFKDSQYRPMLYVDIQDVCETFATFSSLILQDGFSKNRLQEKVINLMWPLPITIIELAKIIQEVVTEATSGRRQPQIRVIDNGIPSRFTPKDKERFKADVGRALRFLKRRELTSPEDSLRRIIQRRLTSQAEL